MREYPCTRWKQYSRIICEKPSRSVSPSSNSGNTSTITAVNYQIWNGSPNDAGSSVIFGDTTTNRLVDTQWTGVYRVQETTHGNTARPIMADTVSTQAGGLYLAEGTYWVDWQADGSASYSGPWAPPVTITGETTTGNALQYVSAWNAVLDTGTSTQQGFPFLIQ